MAATMQTVTAPKTNRWLNYLERWMLRAQPKEILPEHLATGWRGELTAYFHLRRRGYTIVAQGWRSHIALPVQPNPAQG